MISLLSVGLPLNIVVFEVVSAYGTVGLSLGITDVSILSELVVHWYSTSISKTTLYLVHFALYQSLSYMV